MAGARKVTVEIEVPEGLEWLEEKVIASMARASIERRLFLLKRLEELASKPLASKEEILELDKIIKRSLTRRLEDDLSSHSGEH